MNKTIKVAIIGAGATVLAAVIGVLGGKAHEQKMIENQIEEVLGNNVNVIGDGNNVVIYDPTTLAQKYIELQTYYNQLQSDYEQLASQNNYLLGENTKLSSELDKSSQKIEGLEKQIDDIKNGDEVNLSPDELLIKENIDLIQQLKEKYSYKDTVYIQDEKVKFEISENAGYIFQDSMKTGDCIVLHGEPIFSSKVFILDYSSNKIIYIFIPEDNEYIEYYPENDNKFYCVVVHDDYDIYVSPPIQVVGGEYYGYMAINLDRKDSQYTFPVQFRIHVQGLKNESFSGGFSDYRFKFNFKNIYSNNESKFYSTVVSDSGILSWGRYTYFSLNPDYIMDISLDCGSNPTLKSTHQTFDGFIKDSNIIDIYLELYDE